MRFSLNDAMLLVIVLQISAGQKNSKIIPAAPGTEKSRFDEYYGIKVVNNYRWLDDLNDLVVKKWNDEQNLDTRSLLGKISSLGAIQRRWQELYSGQSVNDYALIRHQQKIFATKDQPPKNHRF